MNRIRILQFLESPGVGGTEGQVVNLTRALDPSRFELHFGCLHRWGDLLGELTEHGIPVAEYRINNLYNTSAWSERLHLVRDLKRQQIEVVHTYNFYANVFALPAARLAGVPVIVAAIRGIDVDLTPLRRRVQRIACRLAHRIAVNAEAVRRYLIADGYDPEKVVVIRNGIDLSKFRGRRETAHLRLEFGLPSQAPLVAMFSRLIPLKGVGYFLESAALVAGRVPDARFLVVGGEHMSAPAHRSELERHAARLGLGNRVVFTGNRLDVPDLLSEIAVSVLPSVAGEGLPNAVLEAMAAGVPVVATTVGGNAEAVEDGVTGCLVPPRDAHALARAICQFLQNRALAARFGAAGRERVMREFSLERCVRETAALYSELLAKRRGTD